MRGWGKRLFDLVLSLIALIVLMPLMALIALLVFLCDGRPVFFLQERTGLSGRSFEMVKFRTMRKEDGPQITCQDDKRKTALGAWLRRYRLDELPQFMNVLAGEMSLIGPRPEVPRFIDHDNPNQAVVLSVRPGLIDPAVLSNLDEEEKLSGVEDPERYYCQELLPRKLATSARYIEQSTFWSDCRLLLTATWRIIGMGNPS